MREIKFRGRVDERRPSMEGQWVYGSIVTQDQYAPYIRTITLEYIGVDEKTVGQYIGLKDSKEREIYEGDIVKVVDDGEESFHVVEYMGNEDYPAFDLVPGLNVDCNGLAYCEHYADYDVTLHVIGNIHDNPEMWRLCNA